MHSPQRQTISCGKASARLIFDQAVVQPAVLAIAGIIAAVIGAEDRPLVLQVLAFSCWHNEKIIRSTLKRKSVIAHLLQQQRSCNRILLRGLACTAE